MRIVNFLKIWWFFCYILFISLTSSVLYGQTVTPYCKPGDSNPASYECAFKRVEDSGGKDHEPPVGGGVGSMFFDIPKIIGLEKAGKRDGYRVYKIVGTQARDRHNNQHKKYIEIFNVVIMTEDEKTDGEVTLHEYRLAKQTFAQLRLWLGEGPNETLPDDPDIIISVDNEGDNDGEILTLKRLKHKRVGKKNRPNKFVRSSGNLRVVKWAITNSKGEKILNFGDENDDIYYFYVKFRH